MNEFSPKTDDEKVILQFDFTTLLSAGETIASVVVSVVVLVGVDATPSALLSGSPVIASGVVKHMVQNGVLGAHYYVRALATTSLGQKFELGGRLVITDRPE